MTLIPLKHRRQLPRVDLGASRAKLNPDEIEFGLMQVSVKLDEALAHGNHAVLAELVRQVATVGAFEVLMLLRDLQMVLMREDTAAIGALHARIQRQIDADLDFVLSYADPSGQSDR